MTSLKGPGEAKQYDGSNLRVGIIHARWNTKIIDALVNGAKQALISSGVRSENIEVQTVPGSYELPLAAQRMYASSQIQSSTAGGSLVSAATDLLASTSTTDLTASVAPASAKSSTSVSTQPFDAVIAVGVLIKGETMHFEYIADAVSHGLMRVQLDSGVPIIFGLLTVLNEEQGMARAGIDGKGHNHGEDWGNAAVELGVKRKGWAEGQMIE
ncbi:MAG: hypothetical protein M1820_006733 [Bogoriella megaspora]|nr:MAG: hypothetical protein M1820_006733 [Bogoriella megaspora]